MRRKVRAYLYSILWLLLFSGGMALAQISAVDHWETLVFAEDTWRYFPGTMEPPSGWMQTDFADTSWLAGPGGIGYGDGDDNTVIDPVISVYLRRRFTIADKSVIGAMLLNVDYDDAFVAYLNGVEIARANIGTAGVPPSFVQTSAALHEARMYRGLLPESFLLTRERIDTLLKEGNNVLALQVHNQSINSSDLTAIAYLSAGITDTTFTYRTPPAWLDSVLPLTSSNLPLVLINTYGREIPDEPRIIAHMKIIHYDPEERNHPDDPPNDYDGRISIEIHGESSTMFPKKCYRLETQDSLGENNNVKLLGMPKENDWILYAPYSDKSLIRNALAYRMGNVTGRYAPRTRFCELLLNDQYMGVYLLTEKIKRDKHRVNISKLKPEDTSWPGITGGYIWRVDKIDPDEYAWTSYPDPMLPDEINIIFQYYYPKYDRLTESQRQYAKDFIASFESALNGSDFTSPTEGYAKYADVESFIDFLIINEISKNVDAYTYSTYMYKDEDTDGGKLNMGPLWDFNLAYGNVNYNENSQYAPGWTYQEHYRMYWYRRLMQDPQFVNHLKCRWDTLRRGPLSDQRIGYIIDSLVSVVGEAQQRNFARWPVLGEYVWPNQFIGNSYGEEVDFLKNWISARLQWMDDNMPGDCEAWIPSGRQTPSLSFIDVYPNPFTGEIHFMLPGMPDQDFVIYIFDLTGRKIITLDGHDSYSTGEGSRIDWNGQALKRGMYLIRAVRHNRVWYYGKIMKE